MADKWNDKLRRQMSDYTQTPPDGLWDQVESRIRRSGAPFPWWWAFAGVAAAALALVLVVTPRPVSDKAEPTLAVADTVSSEIAPMPLQPVPALPEIAARPKTMIAKTSEVSPAETPEAGDEKEAPASVAPEAVAPEAVAPEAVAPETQDEQTSEEERKPEVRVRIVPYRSETGRRPLLADASQPKVRMSLLTSGVPGGSVSNTVSEFGMPPGLKMASPSRLLSRNRSTVTQSDYSMLYRFGLMANIGLSEHWGIETGLQLSRLKKEVVSTTGSMSTSTSTDQYYLGVPLLAVYTPWSGRNLSVYLSAGPMAEYGIRLSGSIREVIGGNVDMNNIDKSVPGDWIWSAGANAGVQLQLGRLGAVFVQPGITYHIPEQEVQESYYTVHPFAFNLAFGLRLLL